MRGKIIGGAKPPAADGAFTQEEKQALEEKLRSLGYLG